MNDESRKIALFVMRKGTSWGERVQSSQQPRYTKPRGQIRSTEITTVSRKSCGRACSRECKFEYSCCACLPRVIYRIGDIDHYQIDNLETSSTEFFFRKRQIYYFRNISKIFQIKLSFKHFLQENFFVLTL